ncbi:MAG: adenosylcobalamin-dependent ribonucleoside-diphosphate reductase [Candidatus Aenigmarchaeota archaeon]|nr:adenosylcobalamin-dependent ribonucleoside-diphosphate reductase [Candidatus Aenigmarchaeota archaeon]
MLKVRKRDNRIVPFNKNKIIKVIHKAFTSVGKDEKEKVIKITEQVVDRLEKKYEGKIVNVEDIQNVVEEILIKNNLVDVAKSFILYRQKHKELREMKSVLGIEDDLKLPINSLKVLKARYLRRNEEGKIVETPKQLFKRVANAVAEPDKKYDLNEKRSARRFYNMMCNLEFMPNSPTLFNAGTNSKLSLSACFVLPVPDSMEGIFDGIKNMALVQMAGGGTGFSFSRLRPKGDIVKSTMGQASGPVSFMRVFNVATEIVKQGGKRRGANMGILRVDHPDIIEFISCKESSKEFTNFNLSIGITDSFMEAVEKGVDYELINPRDGKVVKKLNARKVFSLITTFAWKNGDPGIVFLDEINRHNPNPEQEMESTNPCGEQPLLPYESCNLGSINLSKMVKKTGEKYYINWRKLKETSREAVNFLDNIVDINSFPIKEIEKATRANRKIGLGIMGFADMLILLGIPYNSEDAEKTASEIMEFITETGRERSRELGKDKGNFPNFSKSIWKNEVAMRNATVTTIAPTGTIGIISNCSAGVEPIFAVSYMRNVAGSLGENLVETNRLFEIILKDRGLYNEDIIRKVSGKASIQNVEEIPEGIRKIFVSAHDVSPEWHLRIQAAFQKHTDNAVSKTINLPNTATIQDVEKIYMLAWKMKCKGTTIYRDMSRSEQIISFYSEGKKQEEETPEDKCPHCKAKLVREEGCKICKSCGYSVCG